MNEFQKSPEFIKEHPYACELPDGNIARFSEDQFGLYDVFFSSKKYEKFNKVLTKYSKEPSFSSIQEDLQSVVDSVDVDAKRLVLSNIILSGGNTCLSKFGDRLDNKLPLIYKHPNKLKIIFHPKKFERKVASWVGGSIVSSTSAFQNLWISKFEYEEMGSNAIFRKCLT
jgi:actin-related protein